MKKVSDYTTDELLQAMEANHKIEGVVIASAMQDAMSFICDEYLYKNPFEHYSIYEGDCEIVIGENYSELLDYVKRLQHDYCYFTDYELNKIRNLIDNAYQMYIRGCECNIDIHHYNETRRAIQNIFREKFNEEFNIERYDMATLFIDNEGDNYIIDGNRLFELA